MRKDKREWIKIDGGFFPSDEFEESDAPIKLFVGGFRVGHRLAKSPRDFFEKLKGAAMGLLIFAGLFLVVAFIVIVIAAIAETL